MRILSYEYQEPNSDWHFQKIEFQRVNLVVGDSGTGKTRLLNTIFNLGRFAAEKKSEILQGKWDVTVEQDGKTYRWVLDITHKKGEGNRVVRDDISILESDGSVKPLVQRTAAKFIFDGREIPRLSRDQTSVLVLQEEALIRPLHAGFGSIMRRRFSDDELEKASTYQSLPRELVDQVKKAGDLKRLFGYNLHLNARLFLLQQYFPSVYSSIVTCFRDTFPFITDVSIKGIEDIHKGFAPVSITPVFCIKESAVKDWIELAGLSSGMQKVLLILTDLHLLPDGGVYMIDEYENSLGVSAIDFLPSLLEESEKESQLIMTSHHPYIINQIPMENWVILHRSGSEVSAKYGHQLEEQFGPSRQEAFIKLLNDPFYRRGVD